MRIKLLEFVPRGSQVRAWIELVRFFGKDLADHGRHGQAAVGINVDLADGAFGRLPQLLLGNAHRVAELAAKLLDDFEVLDGNAG